MSQLEMGRLSEMMCARPHVVDTKKAVEGEEEGERNDALRFL